MPGDTSPKKNKVIIVESIGIVKKKIVKNCKTILEKRDD